MLYAQNNRLNKPVVVPAGQMMMMTAVDVVKWLQRQADWLLLVGSVALNRVDRTHNLYVIRSGTRNQYKSFSNGVLWSYLSLDEQQHWWRTAVGQRHVSEGPPVQRYSSPPLTRWTPPSVLLTIDGHSMFVSGRRSKRWQAETSACPSTCGSLGL